MNIRAILKKIMVITACVGFSAVTACAGTQDRGNKGSEFQGRNYRLYTPASVAPDKNAPLLVVLHGGLGNAAGIETALGMNAVADQYGFRVAYLNGTEGRMRMMKDKRTWNAGGCCGIAERENIDDVGYIAAFINEMGRKFPVSQVYLAGHSNGAMMAYRFVCERPGTVDAMVAVSGSMMVNSCASTRTRVLAIHGEADNNVPFNGGVGSKSITKVNYKSVDRSAREMKQAGASFDVTVIPGGGHHLGELNQAAKSKYSASIAEIIGQYLSGKSN